MNPLLKMGRAEALLTGRSSRALEVCAGPYPPVHAFLEPQQYLVLGEWGGGEVCPWKWPQECGATRDLEEKDPFPLERWRDGGGQRGALNPPWGVVRGHDFL